MISPLGSRKHADTAIPTYARLLASLILIRELLDCPAADRAGRSWDSTTTKLHAPRCEDITVAASPCCFAAVAHSVVVSSFSDSFRTNRISQHGIRQCKDASALPFSPAILGGDGAETYHAEYVALNL